MKKFVCLLLVAMLALSLSVAVFARDERCPCGGKLAFRTLTEETGDYAECSVHDGMMHPYKQKIREEYCVKCGDVQGTTLIGSPYYVCNCK